MNTKLPVSSKTIKSTDNSHTVEFYRGEEHFATAIFYWRKNGEGGSTKVMRMLWEKEEKY